MNRKTRPVLWIRMALALLAMGTGCKQDRPADPEQWEGLPCSAGEFDCLEPHFEQLYEKEMVFGGIMACDPIKRLFVKGVCVRDGLAGGFGSPFFPGLRFVACRDVPCNLQKACEVVLHPAGTSCLFDNPPPGLYGGVCDDRGYCEIPTDWDPDSTQEVQEPESE